jgi:hypothetical protein
VTNLAELYINQQGLGSGVLTGYLGLSWEAVDNVRVDAAVESPSGQATDMHVGLEAAIDPHILLRAGTETSIGLLTAGLGLRYDKMQLDFALVQHPVLGSTLSFGIVYAL